MKTFLFYTAVIAVGSFIALIAWTLIVKTQVQQQLDATASSNPLAKLLGL